MKILPPTAVISRGKEGDGLASYATGKAILIIQTALTVK